MPDEFVRMEHINKFFGRVQALNDVTLSGTPKMKSSVWLGDNGGKSTLNKDPLRCAPERTAETHLYAWQQG